jgi:alpha-glucuronidase
MKTEDFNNLEVKNQYGEILTIVEISENMATVLEEFNNLYHTTKLFYQGKSVFDWLNETDENN